MKPAALLAATLLGATRLLGGNVSFDDASPGGLPAGWVGGVTGKGEAHWAVVEEASAPSPRHHALEQSGVAKYCWCVQTNLQVRNGAIEVKFKPVSGKEDQAGGLVWRWQDGNNYYVARANALEDNVTIYHTINGIRKERGRKAAKVALGQWHSLRVQFYGPRFQVIFDGRLALEWEDETFKKAGAVGVWTKADSVTLFDDFNCQAAPNQ
jgi:hypothetical protein